MTRTLGDFTILHGVNPAASAICSYLKKSLKRPFVSTIHENRLDALRVFLNSPFLEWTGGDFFDEVIAYPFDDFLIRICIRNSDHLVIVGNSTLSSLKTTYGNLDLSKVTIVHNGINFDRLKGTTTTAPSDTDLSIFFYGRLVSRKGIVYLIKAIAKIKDDFPKLSLEVIGRGPLEQELNMLTEKLGLSGNVHFRGYIPNEQLVNEIERASIVVLPSLFEGGSPFIAALEAMARKKPLVVFDLPFTHDFITHMQNGVLAKPYSVDDLADKIRLLMSDPVLRRRIGQNAYELVWNKFNWDTLADNYLDIYRSCLKKS
jgi:glycosyltransferase involved in cell wall biosynthesis